MSSLRHKNVPQRKLLRHCLCQGWRNFQGQDNNGGCMPCWLAKLTKLLTLLDLSLLINGENESFPGWVPDPSLDQKCFSWSHSGLTLGVWHLSTYVPWNRLVLSAEYKSPSSDSLACCLSPSSKEQLAMWIPMTYEHHAGRKDTGASFCNDVPGSLVVISSSLCLSLTCSLSSLGMIPPRISPLSAFPHFLCKGERSPLLDSKEMV